MAESAAPSSKAAPSGSTSEFVPGQVLVGFEDGVGAAERRQVAENRADGFEENLSVPHLELVDIETGQSVPEAIESLEQSAKVAYAEPDYLMHSAVTDPNDTYWTYQWAHYNSGQSNGAIGPGQVDADMDTFEAWDTTTGANSVVVAVVDTGVQVDHPDLDSRIWTNPGESGSGKESNGVDDDHNGFVDDWRGWSFARNSNDITPGVSAHGTNVSGVIAMEANNSVGGVGTMWQGKVMEVQWGTGDSGPTSDGTAALDYAADMGAPIVNASFVTPQQQAMRDVIAAHPETLFVAAAGNSSGDDDTRLEEPCSAPGNNVVCVAATDRYDQLAAFSNYGDTTVDLAAPGTAVLTANVPSNYVIGEGTSFAAPYVAGIAGLIKARNPSAGVAFMRNALLSTVDQKPGLDGLVVTGGRVNANAALASITDTTAPETTIDSGPSGTIQQTSATFAYSSEAGTTFECKLDSGSFASCPASGKTYSGLTEGAHTFSVRASDAAGNVDQSPASRAFTVAVNVAPETTLDSGPSGTIKQAMATFTYSSNETGATFECKLDSGSFVSCAATGKTYTGLAQGAHSFSVRAKDSGGLVDPSPASRSFSVDTVAPETTIDSGPSGTIQQTSATFAYSSEAGAVFECKLDSGSFASCPASGKTYSGLAQGAHTFTVRAKDAVGNVDGSPATRAFTVNLAPDTTIQSGPSGLSTQASAAFTYSSSESGVSFECRLDSAAFASCPSAGKSYSGLGEGNHTFEVRAKDAGGLVDPSPASRTFTVDFAPQTSILTGPSGVIQTTDVDFTYASNEAGATFECRLNQNPWAVCAASGRNYSGLAEGSYTFEVRSIDSSGSPDPSPASRSFTVNLPPQTSIDSSPAPRTLATSATFTYSSDKPTVTFECRLDSAPFASCPASGKSYSGLADGSHTFSVRAMDQLEVTDPSPETFTWEIDHSGPAVTFTGGPSGLGNQTSASFTYQASEATTPGSWQCKLDNGNFVSCPASGVTYSGLSQGAHTVSVRVSDDLGNQGPAASRSWSVDTIPPDTLLTSNVVGANSASFTYQGSEAGVSFECAIDTSPWQACPSSGANYSGLTAASYVFYVRALDAVGNVDPTPASYGFTIGLPPSDGGLIGEPTAPPSGADDAECEEAREKLSTAKAKLKKLRRQDAPASKIKKAKKKVKSAKAAVEEAC